MNKHPQDADNIHISLFDMVNALSTALDIINPALDSHQKRTCFIAASIAAQTREEEDLAGFWELAKQVPESPFQ